MKKYSKRMCVFLDDGSAIVVNQDDLKQLYEDMIKFKGQVIELKNVIRSQNKLIAK